MSSGITRPLVRHLNVKRELDNLPPTKRTHLKTTLREIAALREPTQHPNVRQLAGHHDLYRARVGTYRAIFDRHIGQIRVLLVDHRENIYNRLDVAQTRSMQR